MYKKNLTNQASYSVGLKEEKMDNKKLYIDELIKNNELYSGLVVDGLLVVEKIIYNNKFINNQLIKVYSLGMDIRYSNLDWRTVQEDLVQDVILGVLTTKKEKITFKEFYSICNKTLYKNLKHWTREIQASTLTASDQRNIADDEKLDNYLLYNSDYRGTESVETQVVKDVFYEQVIDELVRVCTPSQSKYIKEYAKQGSHSKLSGVKNRILKNSRRSLMLRDLYNI